MATRPNERIQALDVLRGFALCGIVFINIYQTLGMRELPTGLALFVQARFYVIFSLLFGIGFASVSIAVALATGSVRATQSTFIIFFPLLFLTPSALPREMMTGWFETAVSLNPMTYVVEAARSFLGYGGGVLSGFLAAALFSLLTFGLTALAFRRRVRMG